MNRIRLLDVKIAYKKLKSYVYHENFSLSLRLSLAKYEEEDIEKKLKTLTNQLNNFISGKKGGLEKHLNSIKVSLMPKSFKEKDLPESDSAFYFSNANKLTEYKLDKSTPFIECSIEIHIISILWIMKIGHKLDAELSNSCYGNRLLRNDNDEFEENSIKLFKRYYLSYNNWRDEAIKKAKELHKLKLDVAILSLDLKNYYNSIDFDLKALKNDDQEFQWLNIFLSKVHAKYAKLLGTFDLVEEKKNKILPIGLISSSILANYYLKDFDKAVSEKIKPEFYGRYVDDIMFVISNPRIDEESRAPVDTFIDKFLADSKLWGENATIAVGKKNTTTDYHIIKEKNILPFQLKKVKLYHFLADESSNLLDEFEKEIIKNSSEFKFQPESKNIFESFENSSYKISYSDSINKFRSIDGFNTDKLGASKHLAKLIYTTVSAEKLSKENFDDVNEKIINFFSGKRSLELNSLWEKVFTFYIVNSSKVDLIKFAKDQIENISKINEEIKDEESKLIGVKTSLLRHLNNCFSMAASLNISFFNDEIIDNLRSYFANNKTQINIDNLTLESIKDNAKNIIDSNLFRHNYLYFPLLNYCNQESNFNFLSKHLKTENTVFRFSKKKIDYSPRFIHYHEVCLFYNFTKWFRNDNSQKKNFNEFGEILKQYEDLNKLSEDVIKIQEKFYPKELSFAKVGRDRYEGKKIVINSGLKKEQLRIGLVNAIIKYDNSKESFLGKPNLSFDRLDEINRVLNESLLNQKCDVIIFPEISIPFQWLSILASFSKKNNIVISCGVEHFCNTSNKVFNCVATILPFTYKKYPNALIDLRLKKDYSPEEIEEIEGHNLLVPYKEMLNEHLKLYVWNDIHFSVFNCFELADIRKRAIFRGMVDFIAAVEHNLDVNYFSNIIESVARDLHSYVIQVNSSNFGDSRITQPAETFNKDILKIKGGENISLITGTIKIKELREFQKVTYSLQKKNKIFKPTPPNFIINRD